MLTIANDQLDKLDAIAALAFARDLFGHLARRQPNLLPRFAPAVREAVMRNMVARADRHGLTWKSTITLYCDLMQSVAPDFDRHPLVRDALESGAPDADIRMRSLIARVPSAVWGEVVADRTELPLYTGPEMDGRPLVDRVAQALPLVLWDRVDRARAPDVARWAVSAAGSLGFGSLDDAPLVVATWRSLDPAAASGGKPGWLADIRDTAVPPKVRLELLRLRIALDHGRRV